MNGNHNIERIAYSNIGDKEVNAGYQIVGKTAGISKIEEDGFAKSVFNVTKLIEDSGYSEALLTINGSAFFTSVSMTTDDGGRPCPISSAIVADGEKWRELLKTPEKLIACSRDYFLLASPKNAEPGAPAELDEVGEISQGFEMPSLDSLRKKYNLDDDKYSRLIEAVYYCLAAKTDEKLFIALPAEQLTPQCARELIYCICMALPASLRALLTYKLGSIQLSTMITIGPTAAIRVFRNYVDLNPEDNKDFKQYEYLRGLEFCSGMVKHAGDEAFLSKMDEFIEAGNLYTTPLSVNFNPDVKKYGKNYLFNGAYLYASGEYEQSFAAYQVESAFTMLSLCQMSKTKTNDTDKNIPWDTVVGNLLKEYGKNPLHTEDSDGELRLDAGVVASISEKGWHNLSYSNEDGSIIAEQFSSFVKSDDTRAEIFEKKCRDNLIMSIYSGLLADIYEPEYVAKHEAGNSQWWYELRKIYVAANNRNAKLEGAIKNAYESMDSASHERITNAADYSDSGLTEEFLDKCDDVFKGVGEYICYSKHLKPLMEKYPEYYPSLFKSNTFASLSQDKVQELLRVIFNSKIDIIEIIHGPVFAKLERTGKANLVKALALECGRDDVYILNFIDDLFKDEDNIYSEVDSETKKEICKELIRDKKTDFCIELLKRISVFENKDISDILDELIKKYNEANEQFIYDNIFTKGIFNCLEKEYEAKLYKSFFSKPHSSELTRKLIKVEENDSFKNLDDASKAEIYESIVKLSSDEQLIVDVTTGSDFAQLNDESKHGIIKEAIAKASDDNKRKIINANSFLRLEPTQKAENYESIIKATGNEQLVVDIISGRDFANIDADSKQDIIKEAIAKVSDKGRLAIINTLAFDSLENNVRSGIIDDLFNSVDGTFRKDVVCSEAFSKLNAGSKKGLTKKFFDNNPSHESVLAVMDSGSFLGFEPETIAGFLSGYLNTHKDSESVRSVLGKDAFKSLTAELKEKLYDGIIENSSDEALLTDILCNTDEDFSVVLSMFTKHAASLVNNKIKSDDNVLKILYHDGISALDENTRSSLITESANGRSADFITNLFDTNAARTAGAATRKTLISNAVDAYAGKDDKFITETVLNSELLRSLTEADREDIYSLFLSKPHSDEVTLATLTGDNFAEFSEGFISKLYNAAIDSLRNLNGSVSLLNSSAFKKLDISAVEAFIKKLLSSEKSGFSVAAGVINSDAFGKLSDSVTKSLVSGEIGKYGYEFAKTKVHTSAAFSKLSSGDKIDVIDLSSKCIADYTDSVGESDTVASLRSNIRLQSIAERELTAFDGKLGESFYSILKGKLGNGDKESINEFLRLYKLNPKLIRAFLNKVYNENGKRWGEYTKLADIYFSNLSFNPPKNLSKLKSAIASAENNGLVRYAGALEKIKTKKVVTATVLSAAAAAVALGAASTLYVLPKFFDIDPFNVNEVVVPYSYTMYVTDENPGLIEIGYNKADKTLKLYTASGSIYKFYDVPSRVYSELLETPERGKYYNENIRDSYAYELISDEESGSLTYEIIKTPSSSGFIALGYNKDERRLRTYNRSGKVYDFFNVPESVYEEFISNYNLGEYYNSNIRRDYSCKLVAGADVIDVPVRMTETPDCAGFMALGYNAENRRLVTYNRSGKVYVFFNVPERVYEELISDSNMGKYYNDNIRADYSYEVLK